MPIITLIPGDGIGPEITEATKKVIAATNAPIEWEIVEAGEVAYNKNGTPLPEEVLTSIKKNRVALKGPLTTPIGSGFRSVNVGLRKELDLYANLRPAKSLPGAPSLYDNLDLVIVRENTEGLYAGVEHYVGEDAAETIKIITRKASERIIYFAFEYAKEFHRKKVTLVHKANIMKCTDGLFLGVGREIAKEYPSIEFEERIVDNMAMQLVQKPKLYDVIVTTNMYGDILSDLCAGLVGGLGLAPGANFGEEIAIFEPVHGSAPKYAGLNKANPLAMILSSILMLEHLGFKREADRIDEGMKSVLEDGQHVTYDLGGEGGTEEMAGAIVEEIQRRG